MNGLGRYEEALASAIAASDDTPELVVSIWSLSELIEAASRVQDTDAAESGLARLAAHANGTDAEWALGMLARGGALLEEGDEAELLYREAIDRLGRTRLLPDFARARLLYGEWLRRENRRADARKQLRLAYEAFLSMGAEAFAERARHELLATGEKVRSRREDTRDELTPRRSRSLGSPATG